jgi:hypothetical protein
MQIDPPETYTNIDPLEFYSAMHDPTLDITCRIRAAKVLVRFGLEDVPLKDWRCTCCVLRHYANGRTLTSLGWDGEGEWCCLENTPAQGNA